MPTTGQQIVYRLSSTRYLTGLVGSVVSGSTIHAIVFGDGAAWGDGEPATLAARCYTSVAEGTAVGEWQSSTVIPTLITEVATPIAAAEAAEAVSEIPADDDSGLTVVAAAGSSVSLALNTARQPSSTRPTRVTVTGTWTWALTAIGSVAGTVTLQSDSSNPPTTARVSAAPSKSLTLGVAVNLGGVETWTLTYDVPAGHYYRIATSGAGTFAISAVNETAG